MEDNYVLVMEFFPGPSTRSPFFAQKEWDSTEW